MHFIPKTLGIVLAAILLNNTNTAAQDNTFAYNSVKPRHESPAPAPYKLDISRVQADSLVFRVTVENPGSEKLMLYIRDNSNNTLHREQLPAAPLYTGRFNLQGLEDGNYTFEVRNGRNKLAERSLDIKTVTTVNRRVAVE